MKCYGLGYRDVLNLPLKMFWLLNKNVDRHYAEDDVRTLMVAAHAHTGEAISEYNNELRTRIGTIVEYDVAQVAISEKLDRAGLRALKDMNRAY